MASPARAALARRLDAAEEAQRRTTRDAFAVRGRLAAINARAGALPPAASVHARPAPFPPTEHLRTPTCEQRATGTDVRGPRGQPDATNARARDPAAATGMPRTDANTCAANSAEEQGDSAGATPWQLARGDVELGAKLGSGNFGDVFRGTLAETGLAVAVKTCRDTARDPARFLDEAAS